MSEEISFEARLSSAKQILEKLSDNELPLNEGMKLYKEGMNALNEAVKMLESAKLEFETLDDANTSKNP